MTRTTAPRDVERESVGPARPADAVRAPAPAPRGARGGERRAQDGVVQHREALGNATVGRLIADRAPAPVSTVPRAAIHREKVAHTPGKTVDTYLETSKFFKSYVAAAMKGGTSAESAVQIHKPADFKKEWLAYALVRTNPDTGKTFTKAEAEAWEPNVNAFQAPGKIHIHEERGEAGTAIHESLHLFTDSGYSGKYGFNINEGTTEVFTRKLCTEQSIARGAFYTSQRTSLDRLVGVVGESTLADAYFHGKYDELKAAVDGAKKKEGTFDTWVVKMKQGKYSDADALL